MRDNRYQSQIPAGATETITATYENDARATSEYLIDGKAVGKRHWDENGNLSVETPLKDGVRHGVESYMYEDGTLVSAEPYCEGQMHGTTYQWDCSGRLIGTYAMVHGTGIDLWRGFREDGSIYLSEVRYYQNGNRHGFEWWINEDQETVHVERHFKDDEPHGIEREWNVHGHLRRGFPRYSVNGRKVTKRQYLAACKIDASLPLFRAEENEPERTFPPEVCRELGQAIR